MDALRHSRANRHEPGEKYVVERTVHAKARDWLIGGRDVILLGRVANGKTTSIKTIAADVRAAGIKVFEFIRETETTPREVDEIIASTDPLVVVIDDCYSHIETVTRIATRRRDNVSLLLSGKTQGFAYFRSDLENSFGNRYAELLQYRLDTLDEGEQNAFLDAFESLALLGDYAGLPCERLRARVTGVFSSQLQTILLEIVKSETVQKRIASELGLSPQTRDRQRFIAAALVLSLVGHPSVVDVAEVSGVRATNAQLTGANTSFNEILVTRDGALEITSAILARHI